MALLMASFSRPACWNGTWRREKKVELDDLATVIFSSGSTGEPKGVMLSHYNIGVEHRADWNRCSVLTRSDCVLGVLPFFHSFGFTGTLWLPAVVGVGVVYHPNPLDAKTIGPLVRDYPVTFLLATPTFLQLYMRGCAPEDFGSLRVVMTGAEKLPERLATAFEEQFGIRPLEGYGCTECSPGRRGEHARFSLPPAFARSAPSAARSAIRCPASPCASWIRTRARRCRSASRACCSCAART